MTRLIRTIRPPRANRETGATAVEYALMVTFIAIVIIVAVLALGTKLSSFFIEASTLV
jgi:pilus assembly protein Flp/PilA